jgi:hypothetical protein
VSSHVPGAGLAGDFARNHPYMSKSKTQN